MFSAKGAVFNLEPVANAPGLLEIQTPALKARFTFPPSEKLNESLSALVHANTKFPGALHQAEMMWRRWR